MLVWINGKKACFWTKTGLLTFPNTSALSFPTLICLVRCKYPRFFNQVDFLFGRIIKDSGSKLRIRLQIAYAC